MEDLKKIIDELGIDSLENKIHLAGAAVLADSGDLIFQTSNWDLHDLKNAVLSITREKPSFVLNDAEFKIVEKSSEGIIATNINGRGHVLFTPLQGGVLLAYAMPQADPSKALDFLKKYTKRLKVNI